MGEGDNRGWDGWMASLTQWTWVWINCGSWCWTGRPGMLQSMGSQRIWHDWGTELNWIFKNFLVDLIQPQLLETVLGLLTSRPCSDLSHGWSGPWRADSAGHTESWGLRHGLALPESVLNRISYEVAHLSQGLVHLKASGDQPQCLC